VSPGTGEGGCVGEPGGPDRDMARESLELSGDGAEDDGLGAPRPADDDEFGVGEGDYGGEDAADRLGQGCPQIVCSRIVASDRRQQCVHVDCCRSVTPEAQRAEHIDEGDGPAIWADREDVGDFADQAGVSPAYHLTWLTG
jgi:hypothetical protein